MPADAGDAFEEFWREYPKERRLAKPDARAAFKIAVKKIPARQIIDAVKRYAADPNRLDEFTPYPQKWLKQERWNAPPEPVRRQNGAQAKRDNTLTAAQKFLQKQQAGQNPPELTP